MEDLLQNIINKKDNSSIVVHTLGRFEVFVESKKLNSKDWGRDKSIQLFQFLLMSRNRRALHKEQIVDKLWEDDIDDQGFKVAMHGLNKALQPDKKSHGDAKYMLKIGQTYQLNTNEIWIDSIAFEELINIAIKEKFTNQPLAIIAYRMAIELNHGQFLPERLYEDWPCDERERLQLMYLNACVSLAEIVLESNPSEAIQLCQNALLNDNSWEDAYRIQMLAFFKKGNRPMAVKTFQACEKVLFDEMGLKPLPETRRIYSEILVA